MRGPEQKKMPLGIFPKTLVDIVSSTESFSKYTKVPRYQANHTCRESVHYRVRELKSIFSDDSDCTMGIQSTGQQYSTVARILTEYSEKSMEDVVGKTLERLFKKVFDISLEISYGIATEKDINKMFGGGLHYFRDKNGNKVDKNSDGYVTIYLNCKKNPYGPALSVSISAILAILREPVIVEKIVSGKISTRVSLANELVNISSKRAAGNLCGYFNISGYGNGNSEKYLTDSESSYIRNSINGDGSDWLSLFLLAGYCVYNSELDVTSRNGPVNSMMSSPNSIKGFVKKIKKLPSMKIVSKRCGKIDPGRDSSIYLKYMDIIRRTYEEIS
jgi:hypothetical protein